MLVYNTRLIGTSILSVQDGGVIGAVTELIVNPDDLKVIAFRVSGPGVPVSANLLDVSSVREYSNYGMVIDSTDELVGAGEVIKIDEVVQLNFNLVGLKVETRKGSKLGQVMSYTMSAGDFMVQQIIVQRPLVKRLMDPELTISRKEIVEINDYKIIVKDEEKVLKARAEKEDFVPNFVNPFRKTEPDFVPSKTEDEE